MDYSHSPKDKKKSIFGADKYLSRNHTELKDHNKNKQKERYSIERTLENSAKFKNKLEQVDNKLAFLQQNNYHNGGSSWVNAGMNTSKHLDRNEHVFKRIAEKTLERKEKIKLMYSCADGVTDASTMKLTGFNNVVNVKPQDNSFLPSINEGKMSRRNSFLPPSLKSLNRKDSKGAILEL